MNNNSQFAILIFLLFLPFSVSSQSSYCGADELFDWQRSLGASKQIRQLQVLYQSAQQSLQPKSTVNDTFVVPVVFHIVADNVARLNSFPASRIDSQLAVMNRQFAQSRIRFCLAQNIHFLPNQMGTYNTNLGISGCATPYATTTTCPVSTPYSQGENHMDYYTETCLRVFTAGQTTRMHNTLTHPQGRQELVSARNRIATGIQDTGSLCVNLPPITAEFTMSQTGVCAGSSQLISLTGISGVGTWNFSIRWNPARNNGQPVPSGRAFQLIL